MVPAKSRQCFVCGYEFPGSPLGLSWRTLVAIILLAIFLIPLIRLIIRSL
jgi:hypothetical protein